MVRRFAGFAPCLLGLLAPAFAAVRPASAQIVVGHVLESGTRTPVPWTTVALVDSLGVDVTATISDQAGRFELTAPAPGNYFIRAERIGYSEVVDGILELGAGGRLEIEFFVRPDPVEIEEIRVAERRRVDRYLERQGFYERLRTGAGSFLTPDEISASGPVHDVPALLQRIPFVQRLDDMEIGSTVQLLGRPDRSGVRRCIPEVYIDGVRWTGGLQDYVQPDAVHAVEVYRGAAQIPLEYSGFNNPCGVVLIWTEVGRPAGTGPPPG